MMTILLRRACFVGLMCGLAATSALAGDWGVRLGGDIGYAPEFNAKLAFNSYTKNFKFQSRSIELGAAYKDYEASFFMQTPNKSYINRGYNESVCGYWTKDLVCLPEGTYIDAVGIRLIGAKVGGFKTLAKKGDRLRFGALGHFGLALYNGQATRVDDYIEVAPINPLDPRSPVQVIRKRDISKVGGYQILRKRLNPLPLIDVGLGLRAKTSSWAEIDLSVRLDTLRLPIIAWGMTFRKNK